jgi:hypothetical protein
MPSESDSNYWFDPHIKPTKRIDSDMCAVLSCLERPVAWVEGHRVCDNHYVQSLDTPMSELIRRSSVAPFKRHEALLNQAWRQMKDQILLKNLNNDPKTHLEVQMNRNVVDGRMEARWCKTEDCHSYAAKGSFYCLGCKQGREDMGLGY